MTYYDERSFASSLHNDGADGKFGPNHELKQNALIKWKGVASKRGPSHFEGVGADSVSVYGNPFTNHEGVMLDSRNKVIMKCREAFDDALLISDLVYAKSTIATINARAQQLLRLTRRIKRGDIAAIKRASKNLDAYPSAWLEWNFVYRPLAGSISSFIDVVDNPLLSQEVRALARCTDTYKSSYGWFDSTSVLNNAFYYAKGRISVENPNQNLVSRLGLTDIIGLAIDVAPWSWAVSYFTNVTDYIGNFNPRYNNLVYEEFRHGYQGEIMFLYEDNQGFGWSSVMNSLYTRRIPGKLPGISFKLVDVTINLRQTSYLMSAIALTLKGKFS